MVGLMEEISDLFVVGMAQDKIVWEPLKKVRDWCCLPYPGHPKGCRNRNDCRFFIDNLRERVDARPHVMLAWLEFDLDAHAAKMKERHLHWTRRQCTNLLYWQKTVRKALKENIRSYFGDVEVILGAEGAGVNYYRTMKKLGVRLDMPKDLHTVRIIAVVLA